MILNSVFLSPIVSFYFILFCVFYFIHFSSFLFEILDIRIEFIEKQTKRYAIVLNDMLLESLFVWWRMAIPIPSQCAVEQHEEALRFCLTVLLFCADFPFCLIAERRSRRKTCRGRAEDFVLFGNRLFTRICYLYYLLPFSDLLKTIHSGNV